MLGLVRSLLGIGVLFAGILGTIMAFNTEKFGTKGIALLILTIIMLIVLIHAWDLYLFLFHLFA